MAAAPVQALTKVAMPSAAPLPKLWHWESETNLRDAKTHCQEPQSIPALGLFIFDDFQNIYVLDLSHQKAQLRKTIPVKDYLYGWSQAEGQLFIIDGTVLSSYELTEGEVTLDAELDLHDGAGASAETYASMRVARQRIVWGLLPLQFSFLLMFLGAPGIAGSGQASQLGLPDEWLNNPRVSFAKATQTASEEAESKEPLTMPRPPLPDPPKPVPREELQGDLSTALLLATLDALHVLGLEYRPELDAPTLCAYLQDHPLELRLWFKFLQEHDTQALPFQELAQLRSSIPAFSAPVLKDNAEGFRDNLFVLRSDGVILGCNSSLQQARADKSIGPATVTKYRGTGSQALVEAGLTFVDETQTFFYISSDKGLCSVSLQGRAPQSFLPSTDSTPPAKPDSLDGPRIHHVAVPDGSGDQMWACLPALCGFSAGASGGNSPLAAPDFAPLETGWDTVFDVDGGDQLVLTVSGLGLTRLFYASRPSTVPPAPLKPLWSLGPVGFGDPPRDRRWFGVLAPPDPFATKASQAATNIKFPAALLMEAGDAGAVSTTTLTVIEDCNSFKALEGPTDAASLPVVPMGFIEGTAVCAPVLHVSNQGRREVVVQWQQSEGPIDLQNLVVQEMHIWSPAPGSNLAASSPWNAAVGAKSLEQLLSEGPPDLLPAMNFKYKSALSCYALHLPSKPA